jgi:hypothetical protein
MNPVSFFSFQGGSGSGGKEKKCGYRLTSVARVQKSAIGINPKAKLVEFAYIVSCNARRTTRLCRIKTKISPSSAAILWQDARS